MKTVTSDLTVADKTAIARGWQSSGLDQASYAAMHGISPRTLRSWIMKYAPTGMPEVRAREIIERAIADLQAVLVQLEEKDDVPEDVPVHADEFQGVEARTSSMPTTVPQVVPPAVPTAAPSGLPPAPTPEGPRKMKGASFWAGL